MRHVHVVTGRCGPQTQAEARLELADIAEEQGEYRKALEYRAIVARWRRDWREKGPATKSGNPDAPVPDHGVMYWHSNEATGVVCPCGHFAGFLCDEPVGRGLTCDMALCKCCRSPIGDDLDLCAIHAPRHAMVAMVVAQPIRNDPAMHD